VESTESSGVLLIVDDEAGIRKTLAGYFRHFGYSVETADGLSQARERIRYLADSLEAVISDVSMPDGTGVDLLDYVQILDIPPPVILLTAYADMNIAVAGIRKKAFDLLSKPPDMDLLRHVVERAVRFHRLLLIENKYTHQLEAEVKIKTSLLLEHQHRLEALVSEVSLAEEKERRRIAAELHDNVGQTLIFAKMKFAAFACDQMPQERQHLFNVCLSSLESAIHAVRSITVQISPPLLYEVGLGAALESLGESFGSDNGLEVSVETEEMNRLNEEYRIVLYQSVRELLVNIAKHARASSAWVKMHTMENVINVNVEDNGVGI